MRELREILDELWLAESSLQRSYKAVKAGKKFERMIEKRFRDLVNSYLHGNIGPAEVSWVVGDLVKSRDRRDLFIEKIEESLISLKRDSNERACTSLRALLRKDLSQIKVEDLQRAMPSVGTSPNVMRNRADGVSGRSYEQKRTPLKSTVVEARRKTDATEESEQSYALPVIGILIIIGTFFFMVNFSSLSSDKKESEEETALTEHISDAEALRQTAEFLNIEGGDGKTDEAGSFSEEDRILTSERPKPVSLVDLVENMGTAEQDGEPATLSDSDELFILRNSSEAEVISVPEVQP